MTDHFATIESAQEYMGKLGEALAETKTEVEKECETLPQNIRRYQVLMLARYKFELLDRHLTQGLKLLNDLRRLDQLCR